MTKTIRYAFNSQEGYDSAKKALDLHKVSYSAGSDPGTLDVQVDDEDNGVLINEIIGRQMAKDGVNGRFTSSLFQYDFNVPRDFGPNDELIANLEALKQVLKSKEEDIRQDFLDYLDSLPKRQADDLLTTICGQDIDYTGMAEDYSYNCERLSDDPSFYPDAAYESMKEFVKQCFAKRYLDYVIEIVKNATDCSVTMDFPYVGDPADALDVIIKNRKRNI
jgi:hypothetical protein